MSSVLYVGEKIPTSRRWAEATGSARTKIAKRTKFVADVNKRSGMSKAGERDSKSCWVGPIPTRTAMKKIKKPFKYAYVQDWGTYPNQTLVCVGLNRKEILAKVHKIVGGPSLMKACENLVEVWNDLENEEEWDASLKSRGLFVFYDSGCSILWLREWDGDWEYMDVLNHEVAHAVHDNSKYREMSEENEAKAYMHEYMFREIRQTLNSALERGK